MLNLLIMRHGTAEGMVRPDFQRRLTDRGVEEARGQGRFLVRKGVKLDRIIHSPYERARHTAELVNESLSLPMEVCDHLVPGGDVDAVLDSIGGVEGHLLLVCHLPIIAEIAMDLSGRNLGFFPATIAAFKREDSYARTAEFEWYQNA